MHMGIKIEEAQALISLPEEEYTFIITRAEKTRLKHRGNKVSTCSITNAKSGNCSEDCSFCAQSHKSSANIEKYPLMSVETLFEEAKKAKELSALNFSIVTSGRSITTDNEKNKILSAIKKIRAELGLNICCSLGLVDEDFLKQLKEAGLSYYHHNLETSKSYYHEICSTRTFDDNYNFIKLAKSIGLKVCCGGIFGMGETELQRVELLESIRELDVDSVALNFYNPIDGTVLAQEISPSLSPRKCLIIISVARLMMPEKYIRICGGRELNIRSMQSWIFGAGADGIMVGSYLTTSGRSIEHDLQLIDDCGLIIESL